MSKRVSDARDKVIELLDRLGRPLSKADWVELCEEVASDAESRAEATKEELGRDGDGEK